MFAAGAFDLETGLKIVKKRGELTQHVTEGAMATVLGLTCDKVASLIEAYEFERTFIANFNSYRNLTLTGDKTEIDEIVSILQMSGASNVIPIKASGAFHCCYMDEASNTFLEFLNTQEIKPLNIPVISNLTGKPFEKSDIRSQIAQQLNHQVRWVDTIEWMLAAGCQSFVEIGESEILVRMVDYIQKGFSTSLSSTTYSSSTHL